MSGFGEYAGPMRSVRCKTESAGGNSELPVCNSTVHASQSQHTLLENKQRVVAESVKIKPLEVRGGPTRCTAGV